MDLRGLVQRAVDALREGIEESVKAFIHRQLDPVIEREEKAKAVFSDLMSELSIPIPAETQVALGLLMDLVGPKVIQLQAAKWRDALLQQAERINPADGVA